MADEIDTVNVIEVAEGILDDPTAMEFDEYTIVTVGKGKSRLHEIRNRDKRTVASFTFAYRDRATLFIGLYKNLRYLARGVKALFVENADLSVALTQARSKVAKLKTENHRLKDGARRLQAAIESVGGKSFAKNVKKMSGGVKPFTPDENVIAGPNENGDIELREKE